MGPAPNQGKGLHTAVPTPALLANAVQLQGSNSPSLNFSFLKYKLSGPSLKSQIAPVLISMFLLSTLATLFRNLRLVLARSAEISGLVGSHFRVPAQKCFPLKTTTSPAAASPGHSSQCPRTVFAPTLVCGSQSFLWSFYPEGQCISMKTGILVSHPNTNANTQPKSRVALIDRDAR